MFVERPVRTCREGRELVEETVVSFPSYIEDLNPFANKNFRVI